VNPTPHPSKFRGIFNYSPNRWLRRDSCRWRRSCPRCFCAKLLDLR
jgi:hypothetical protein